MLARVCGNITNNPIRFIQRTGGVFRSYENTQSNHTIVANEGDSVKILIVEDDKKVALTITQLIEKLGYQSDTVETGEDAVKKISENSFDLILLDVYLPDTDALQLIPRLDKIYPRLKIVAMTGYDTAELEKEIRELGVLYYIRKPFTINEFKTLLKHIKDFFHMTNTQPG